MTTELVHDVWIPAPYRDLTGGVERVSVRGDRVRSVVEALDEIYPGIQDRLCEGDQIRPTISVAVNGLISQRGLRERLTEPSEIHFLPAISGGHH